MVYRYLQSFSSAVADHANTAVQTKNGSSIGGRKIGVKHAMHRAPLEQRRSNANAGSHGQLVYDL